MNLKVLEQYILEEDDLTALNNRIASILHHNQPGWQCTAISYTRDGREDKYLAVMTKFELKEE